MLANLDEARTKQVFELFDKDADGKISQDELRDILKTLGQEPTDADLREMIGGSVSGLFTERGGAIDFETFKNMLSGELKTGQQPVTDLQEAFKLLDGEGNGWIDAEKLRLICRKLGEELTAEEVHSMVGEALIGFNKEIYYDGLLKILITQ